MAQLQQPPFAGPAWLAEAAAATASAQAAAALARNALSTPLARACAAGATRKVALLLDAAADDKDAADALGRTPLWLAARHGHAAVVRLLLQAGANPRLALSRGSTPLHVACVCGHEDVVRLLQAGARVDAREARHGLRPLHYAAMTGHANVVQLLVDGGAQLHAPCAHGLRPLHFAAIKNRAAAARVLLRAGADVEGRDVAGTGGPHTPQPPLRMACEHAAADVVAVLVQGGANMQHMLITPRLVAALVAACVARDVQLAAAEAEAAQLRGIPLGLQHLIIGAAAEMRRLDAARAARANSGSVCRPQGCALGEVIRRHSLA